MVLNSWWELKIETLCILHSTEQMGRVWALHGKDGNLENKPCSTSVSYPKIEWWVTVWQQSWPLGLQCCCGNYVWSISFVNLQTEAYLLKNLSKCSWKGYTALLYSLTYFIIVVICDCWVERHLQVTYNQTLLRLYYSFLILNSFHPFTYQGFSQQQSIFQLFNSSSQNSNTTFVFVHLFFSPLRVPH